MSQALVVTAPPRSPAALLVWTPWRPLNGSWLGTYTPSLPGLYRIRRAGADHLTYIGQGIVAGRLAAHVAKGPDATNCQAAAFANPTTLEAAFVLNPSWRRHQLLELENDLIAAHLLTTHQIPDAQFLG